MSARVAAVAGVVVAALVTGVLAAEAFRLVPLAWTLPALGAVVVGTLVVVLCGVETLGLGLLVAALGTATWNGISLGLPLAHSFLAGALAVLGVLALVRGDRISVPAWVWVLGLGVLGVVAASILVPISDGYLAARFEVPVESVIAAEIPSAGVADVLNAVRWLVPAVALPLAVCLALAARPALARRLAGVWVLGAGVSAAVAVSDQVGVTAISARLLPFVDVGGRQAGLSSQPNHLAMSVALAAPVAVYLALSSRGWARALWLAVVAVLAAGLLCSGSRGGLAAAVLAVGAVLVLDARGRRLLAPLAALGAVGAGVALAAVPGLASRAGQALRLSGSDSAAESDAIRDQIRAQALADVVHSPLRGIGLHVMTEGHNIYLQLAASGGVLLLLAFALTMTGALADGAALARRLPHSAPERGLVVALLVAIATWLVVGIVENQIADLYLYVPIALVAGLVTTTRTAGRRRASPPPTPTPVPAPPARLVATAVGGREGHRS